MKRRIVVVSAVFLAVFLLNHPCAFCDMASETQTTVVTASEVTASETTPSQPAQNAPATASLENAQATPLIPAPPVVPVVSVPPVIPTTPSPSTAPEQPVTTANVANPYPNISDSEFILLQQLAAELETAAKAELDQAQSASHLGRYGEDTYIEMLKSFSQAASTLKTALNSSPVDVGKVDSAINDMKNLVLDLDDVFVYNTGYQHLTRGWNECKRILRRVDGIVYREGAAARLEKIIDSNPLCKDAGKSLNVNGALTNIDNGLHRTNATGPMDTLVGHHGGGRGVTHVWMQSNGTYHGQLDNARSDLNEGATQY